jgi:DNA-binding transcriptional LysR family regulator
VLIDAALRYFLEVAECGSIRLAADRLQIAPSAISRQIKLLEHQLGAELLTRNRLGIALTEQGRLVVAFAKGTRREVEQLRSAIDDLSELRRGVVRLAVVEATIDRILPVCISRLRLKFPKIEVTVAMLGTHQVAEAVLRQDAEIGVALDPPLRSELLLRMRWPQPLRAVARPGHPIAKANSMPLASVLEQPHVLPDRSFGIRTLIERSATKRNLATQPFLEANSLGALKALVLATDAVTILPPECVLKEEAAGQLATFSIDDPILSRAAIDVITLRTPALSKAATTLLSFLRRAIADHRL